MDLAQPVMLGFTLRWEVKMADVINKNSTCPLCSDQDAKRGQRPLPPSLPRSLATGEIALEVGRPGRTLPHGVWV